MELGGESVRESEEPAGEGESEEPAGEGEERPEGVVHHPKNCHPLEQITKECSEYGFTVALQKGAAHFPEYTEMMALDVGESAQVYTAFLVFLDLLEGLEESWSVSVTKLKRSSPWPSLTQTLQ
uniref:tRNA-splicing endonuclease subunit Sen15 n=1 Tax=Pristiophorus japonicus TaxID=55135 RepID=UPI00398F1004